MCVFCLFQGKRFVRELSRIADLNGSYSFTMQQMTEVRKVSEFCRWQEPLPTVTYWERVRYFACPFHLVSRELKDIIVQRA